MLLDALSGAEIIPRNPEALGPGKLHPPTIPKRRPIEEEIKLLFAHEAQTLIALVEDGPLPSSSLQFVGPAQSIVKLGWITVIGVHGDFGFYGATELGMEAYCKLLNVSSVAEGRLKRQSSYNIKKK